MSKFTTLKKLLRGNPHDIWVAVFYNLVNMRLFCFLPDEVFLKLAFRVILGEKLNLHTPQTFNEKLQWLKLNDRNPIYTCLVDKLRAKEYVKKVLGPDFVIPTLEIWDNPNQITTNHLPNSFVIKTNNGSGGNDVIVCRNKNEIDLKRVRGSMKHSMRTNTYETLREWPYKNIKPVVFAESYLSDKDGELHDYKFFCFHGKVACFKVDFGRWTEHRANYYSTNLQLIPYGETICPPDYSQKPYLPENIGEMISVAEKLSAGFPFMRVDLYNVHGKIYFGEMTFYPASGLGSFTDITFDYILGGLLKVPFEKNDL